MQKFDTPTPISAVLSIPGGRVRLIAADRADTTVEVRPADGAKGGDVRAAEQTAVTYSDGVLRIHTGETGNRLTGPTGAVEVTVQLPADSRFEGKAAAAELRLSTRQVYNLLARYWIDRRVRSLLLGGERTRKKRLRQDIEEIIAKTLREQWLAGSSATG